MSPKLKPATHTPFNIEIGKKMKQLRLERGMTQVECGRQLGVSFQQIQKYESGTNAVTVEKLLRVAAILSVDLEVFWQDSTDETRFSCASPPDRGTVNLVKIFQNISNLEIRQKVLEIVRKIAEADKLLNKK